MDFKSVRNRTRRSNRHRQLPFTQRAAAYKADRRRQRQLLQWTGILASGAVVVASAMLVRKLYRGRQRDAR